MFSSQDTSKNDWLPQVGGEMGEGGQKVQTYSYKINVISVQCTAW